jgi:uncharacterized protein YoaH (UPF0181 family)
MFFQHLNDTRNEALTLMQEAIAQLVAKGISTREAEERVKHNFRALNLDGNAVITLEALCRE